MKNEQTTRIEAGCRCCMFEEVGTGKIFEGRMFIVTDSTTRRTQGWVNPHHEMVPDVMHGKPYWIDLDHVGDGLFISTDPPVRKFRVQENKT